MYSFTIRYKNIYLHYSKNVYIIIKTYINIFNNKKYTQNLYAIYNNHYVSSLHDEIMFEIVERIRGPLIRTLLPAARLCDIKAA